MMIDVEGGNVCGGKQREKEKFFKHVAATKAYIKKIGVWKKKRKCKEKCIDARARVCVLPYNLFLFQ